MTLFLLSITSNAQKPALDHSVYDSWKSLAGISVPYNGVWAVYYVSPQEGDRSLEIFNIKTGKKYSVPRASIASFSENCEKVVFKISPFFQQTRQAKIDKKKAKEMPKDTLGILDLVSGDITKYPLLKEYKKGKYLGEYIAFKEEEKLAEKKKPAEKQEKKEDVLKKQEKNTTDDKPDKKGESAEKKNLYILNIVTAKMDTIKNVESYSFDESGKKLVYITDPAAKDSIAQRGIFIYEPAIGKTTVLLTGPKKATFDHPSFNEEGTMLAFFANLDTTEVAKKELNIYMYDGIETKMVVSNESAGITDGWIISNKRPALFKDNNKYLTFGTSPRPREKDTTLVEFEQPKLDIWKWNEDYIQPVQLLSVGRDKNKTYLAKIDINGDGTVVQLADELIQSVTITDTNENDFVIATSDKPYRISQQWDKNPLCDVYKISLKDGSRKLIKEGATISMSQSSPDGKYYPFYDAAKKNYYLYNIENDNIVDLTSGLDVAFWNEEYDMPSFPGTYGKPIWFDDSKAFMLKDKYDIWQFDPTGTVAPFMLTEGVGRATKTTYSLEAPLHESSKGLLGYGITEITSEKPLYFSIYNHTTKMGGFAMKDITKSKSKLQKLIEGPYYYANLQVSTGRKPVYIYKKESFETGTDLWMTQDKFKKETKLSDINPQQRDYNWGTVDLVSWKTKDGITAEGLLYKPENFDASKKYPVIIYFYEKNSNYLYYYRAPAPSRSTVNIPYFVSNDYIVFVPDIYYTTGHPGQSALNSILPACDMLCEYPWIDGDNMAIQGQSWGGYQVAYMITQTDRFKAAGAGAPVSNMTSAYGGIRWGSGVTRQFQYEQQQSRIGKNLWDGLDLYIENSPIFFVPNVKTPVLIMHNDEDDAVPWWQGIEFFTALRRCGKVAWMLQYNGETHNLSERKNAKDLSIRLSQFFDHYLKGAPMPVWMKDGIPATLKGIDLGYEY
ncbi:MAG: prolyl oligopeptidase family serine peptidase [Bacteroidales bacterium]|nr:prolyl oligopeptidase family serine peptidase [Bacteroidales bacterium]